MLAASCEGEALVDSAFRGEALFSAPLDVEAFQDFDVDSLAHPRWALFVMRGGLTGDICDVVEHPQSGQPVELGKTELNVFAPPQDELLVTADTGAKYAVMRVMAYEDVDNDREKDDDERFVGESLGGLMYLPQAVDEEKGPTGVALDAGFYNVFWDGPCGPVPRGDDEEDCGVPLGDPCEDDGECGDQGLCLREEPRPGWQGGYCALPAHADLCAPANGRLLIVNRGGNEPMAAYWLKACESHDDCRDADGYFCHPMLGACYQQARMRVQIGRGSKPSACDEYALPEGDMPQMDMPDGGMMSGMDMPDEGMMSDGMSGPPPDCVPPDPRCDGIPGGGGEGPGGGGPRDELANICGAR